MEYFFQTKMFTVGYQGKPVVHNVEAAIGKGQILSLIGPNGAGKSTILKSISKQLKPLGGIACIGGSSIEDISAQALSAGRRWC